MRNSFLYLLLFFSFPLSAGPKHRVPADATAIQARSPKAEKIEKFRQDKAYQYQDKLPPKPTAWDIFWVRFWRWVGEFFNNAKFGTTRSVLAYLFLGGVLAFVILRLMGMNLTQLVWRKGTSVEIPYETLLEDIHGIDYEQQIEKALAQANYRLAVRLGYLRVLKELADKNLITWQLNKTNRSYGYEIRPNLRRRFEQLTGHFEYVWYGEFMIDQAKYQAIRQGFDDFRISL